MLDIPATVRRRRSGASALSAEPLRGFLRALPQVGAPLILFVPRADGTVDRLITSIAQCVLVDGNGRDVFVSTRRSCYVVTLDQPVTALPPPIRARASFDSVEVTQHPGGAAPPVSSDADAETTD